MADTHLVKIMPAAVRDLRSIAKYIRRHSPENAASFCGELLDQIDGLGFMPSDSNGWDGAASDKVRSTQSMSVRTSFITGWNRKRFSCSA